jgi:purine-nucleoside phosphorylase
VTTSPLRSEIESAAAAVRQRWSKTPTAGIILGSGLGDLAKEIAADVTIDYADIPGFPRTTAIGHAASSSAARSPTSQ